MRNEPKKPNPNDKTDAGKKGMPPGRGFPMKGVPVQGKKPKRGM